VIALRAKDVDFEVTYINLRDKPDWFLEISPHGKVPVLVVDEQPLFESNAIAEYLDEVVEPRLHPADPIKRARNRAWTDFVPDFAKGLSGIYYTKTKKALAEGLKAAPDRVVKLEQAIASERGNDGPYFNGDTLSLVDAAYAPFLQRFAFVERKLQTGLLKQFPLVQAWSDALLASDSITGSVASSFEEEFVASLKRREFYVGTLFESESAAAE
jgi:glutathione S-transferase